MVAKESAARRKSPRKKPSPSQYGFMSAKLFARKQFDRQWLIEGLLMKDQPGVIGGPPKCLKTGLLLDMAISLGSATSCLDHFQVAQKRNVAVVSGESGEATIQETMLRICDSKHVNLEDCSIYLKFDLPKFSEDRARDDLSEFLSEAKADVIFIDPLYLCLCTGDRPISTANLYDVGPVLKRMADTCLKAGATPILVHHMTKSAAKSNKEPSLDLSSLAFAGISEFARQWTLVNRRAPYDPAQGRHQLQMATGGSSGHAGKWDIDVREGTLRTDFSGRFWDVRVSSPGASDTFSDDF